MERIYLDNAATTPIDPRVVETMLPYLTTYFGNPSSVYSYGRETRMAIEKARKSVAQILGARPAEIFFTSGGTESSNTVLQAAMRDLQCTRIISSRIEHHATLHTIEHLHKTGLANLDYVDLLPNGHINLAHLEELLSQPGGKTIVTLMHANNEIGNLLDIDAVGELCEKYGALFHSDTVQTVGHYPFNLKASKVHFITGAGHKFHGPKGIGILYISDRVSIHPMIHGGAQERNMRAGTENVYGIIGFAKALELANEQYETDRNYITGIKQYMMQQLQEQIPGTGFNGDPAGKSLYTVLSASFPKTDKSEMLLFNLDIHHICASGGSACSSGANKGSHVIEALHQQHEDRVTVRFSFSRHTTRAEIDYTIDVLKKIL
ncbi:MAG: cysteine desulfurase family protein [Bacteroidota bacterium]|jgi:cysteine desulfurase